MRRDQGGRVVSGEGEGTGEMGRARAFAVLL